MTTATMAGVEEQERYRRVREEIRERAGVIRAELAAAVARVDEHDVRLDAHDRRLDAQEKETGALRARVDAMAPVIRQAFMSERLPVPDALQEAARLQVIPGSG